MRVGTRPIAHENDTGGGLEMGVRSGEIKRRTRLGSTNRAGGMGVTGSAVASVGRMGSTAAFTTERNPMWTGHEKASEEKPIDESRNNRFSSLVRERVSTGRQTSLVKTGSRAQNRLHRKGGVEADSRRKKADRRRESRETAPPRIGRIERTWSGNPVEHLTKKDFESMDTVTDTCTGNVTVRIVDGAVCDADQAGDADDSASGGGGDASGVGEVEGGGAGEITADNGGEDKAVEAGAEKETAASTVVQRRDDDNIMIDL